MGAKSNIKDYLKVASLPVAMVAFLLLLLTPAPKAAATAGINSQISFEGKIVNSDGTNITNGTYNMEFKVYQDGSNTGSGSTLMWTEDYLVAGSSGMPSTGGVNLTNGTFQVNLGSICSFSAGTCGAKTNTGVDFNQNTLWLSMQIGNSSSCTVTSTTTSFNTACGGDGEMTPYIRLTAVPQAEFAQTAISANTLGGTLTAANFVQLAQGIQTDSSTTNASIAVNKTGGSSNILTLQKSGSSVMLIDNNGLVTLQPASGLVGGQSALSETLTNNSSTGGTVNGYNQTLTVSNTSSGSTTNGINIAIADNSLQYNTNYGINISLNGSDSSQSQAGINVSVSQGLGIVSNSSGATGGGNFNCGGVSFGGSIGVCGGSSSSNGTGVTGVNTVGTTIARSSYSAAVVGYANSTGSAGSFYTGVSAVSQQSAAAAYNSAGIYANAGGGAGSTVYAGYFDLGSSAATEGAALYATNGTAAANILELQDATTSATDVLVLADGGALSVMPKGNNIGTVIRQTSGTAISGNIFDIQGSTSTNHFIQVTETAANAGSISITSLGSNAVNIDAGGGTVVFGTNTTTLQKAATALTLDVNNSSDSTLTVTNSGTGVASLSVEGDIAAGTGRVFKVGATSGSTISACGSTQFLASQAVAGGITIGGTCTNAATSLSAAYNTSATTGNTIALSNAGGGFILQDATSSTITNIFSVQNSGGSQNYLTLNIASSTPHLKIYDSTGANYADIYYSGTTAYYGASSGTAVLGSGTGPVSIAAGSGAAVTITGNALSTISTTSGDLVLQGGSGVVSFGNSTALKINGGTLGSTISACSSTQYLSSQAVTGGLVTGGACANVAVSLSGLTAATASNTLANSNNSQTWDWSLTTASTNGLNIGESTASTASSSQLLNITTLAASTAVPLGITNAGNANAFQVQDSGNSDTSLSVDSSGVVHIGSATTDSTIVLLQLDSNNSTFSPSTPTTDAGGTCTTTTNQGSIYYSTADNAVRSCINGSWEDMISTGALGLQLFGIVPDTGTSPGDLAGVASLTSGPCKVYVGSTTTTVAWNSCTAYSGGRKVVVAAGTATVATSNNSFQHLCLTGSNGTPALSASGTETANLTTVSFQTSFATSPILCLADIKTSASAISAIYETATFTTTTKEYATSITTAPVLGQIVAQGATTPGAVAATTAANAGALVGVVVATTGATSTTALNSVVATSGPAWVKAITETGNAVGNTVQSSATAGYAGAFSSPTTTAVYSVLGLARTAWTGGTACTANGLACSGSVLTNISPR